MDKLYTDERNAQMLLYLMKQYGIKKVIASPGATNVNVVSSMQQDSYFEMYSCVDERSAAYMAVGMAEETGEPVVLSCTGATSSRNYLPALTEAYYRKLPVIAVTSSQNSNRIGHLVAQVTDRTDPPRDTVVKSYQVNPVKDGSDEWDCAIKLNQALQIHKICPGPVHINLITSSSRNHCVQELPSCKQIKLFTDKDDLPQLPSNGRTGIFIGSHVRFTETETKCIETFCEMYDAVVFCDHTSNYYGKYKIQYALMGAQESWWSSCSQLSLLIYIGEVSGDYDTLCTLIPSKMWRVSPDGEFRDPTLGKLAAVFAMNELSFFQQYTQGKNITQCNYYKECAEEYHKLLDAFPVVPLSNIYVAKKLSGDIPTNSLVYLGILNTLRSWNYFELPKEVRAQCNVGGFGIEGIVSSCIGASLANPSQLCFAFVGDLSFFYDMNSIGNREIKGNLRVLVVNNGHGQEFENYNHAASYLGDDVNKYVAAAGHFGCKSFDLVKHYAIDLGFEYLSAKTCEEFDGVYQKFLRANTDGKPILFEVFTSENGENTALKASRNVIVDKQLLAKRKIRNVISKIKNL